jgi:kynureninase
MTERDRAIALDAADPLEAWRDEFVISDPELVYLDGNSLGMTPKRTVHALRAAVESQWAGDLISSWWTNGWLDLPISVGNELAPLIGARQGEVVVHESTTICLFQLVNAALDLAPGRRVIAVADDDFPTDRYVAAGIAALRPGVEIRRGVDDLTGVDVVVRSLVDYRTAALRSLADDTARAMASGASTVWDLSHAAGVVAVDLRAAGVEFAAGCTYKFLNGGPGSPAFAFVRSELHEQLTQPIWGWFGQTDQFSMDAPFRPRAGIARLLNGTPPILGLTAARSGISLTAEVGIDAIAAKAAALSTTTRQRLRNRNPCVSTLTT